MQAHNFIKKSVKSAKRELYSGLWKIISPDLIFYVISHERSGTHFVINTILKNAFIKQRIHHIGEWFGPYDKFDDRFVHIHNSNYKWKELHRKASIIKSHCDRDLFEAVYKKEKVIYVLRDPRDTLTSWFHYLNRDEYYRNNPAVSDHRCKSFSEFLTRPISPFLRYSYSLHGNFSNVAERWASHVSGWLAMSDTLVVRYEDLHQNYKPVLGHICEFLGLHPRRRTRSIGLHDAPSILPRRGVVGDWQNMFSGSDEAFVRQAVERAGINWSQVTKVS
jgi:hypothetical protein